MKKIMPFKNAPLRLPSTARSCHGPRSAVRFAPVALVALIAALVLAAPASAAEPLQIKLRDGEFVSSTRAHLEVEAGPTENLQLEWHAEYARSESGPWTAAGSGVSQEVIGTFPPHVSFALGWTGSDSSPAQALLHHLEPNTTYFARFRAKTEGSEAQKVVEFHTTAVGKPEIAKTVGSGVSFFEARATTPFTAVAGPRFLPADLIETNGAQTEYHFDYSTSESGPWAPFTSGASGTVTVAEDFATPKATLSGLAPETKYYARLRLQNEKGIAEEVTSFATPTARPFASVTGVRNVTATSAYVTGSLTPHGAETHWRLESATSPSGPWTPVPGAAGAVSQAQAEALGEGHGPPGIEGRLAGLNPAATYYVRLFAENQCAEGCGSAVSPVQSFETFGPPTATAFATHGLHGEALRLLGAVNPDSVSTSEEQTVTIEGAPSGGTFTLTFGGKSTGAAFTATTVAGSDELTTAVLSAGAFTNGEAISGPGIPAGATIVSRSGKSGDETLILSAPATASASGVGLVANLPYDAAAEIVGRALDNLPGGGANVDVTGPDGGPYTIYFGGDPLAGKNQPPIEANASGLTPAGAIAIATTQQGGEAYDTHSHFEYVSEEEFGQTGWAHAMQTPAVDLGSGNSPKFVAVDLPSLRAGETYRYRVLATSTVPGNPVVESGEQTLTVPIPPSGEEPTPCSNESLRVGPAAGLPSCRAYEQLTPIDKEGAQEIFKLDNSGVVAQTLVGEDGSHFAAENATVSWGSESGSGQSPYFFSRDPQQRWQLTAGASQPETGANLVNPSLFNPDLTEFSFETGFDAGANSESNNVEFKTGPPGGPYATAASVPRKQIGLGWVGASADFSKLVLSVPDHTLLSKKGTGTAHGNDLYEYSQGELRQLNVDSAGKTIGTCGATLVNTRQLSDGAASNALSATGSRVFFEAVPNGHSCSEATNLYMRVNGGAEGAETADVGAYRFLAADAQGTQLLLERGSGEAREFLLYESNSAATKLLFSTATPLMESGPAVSGEFNAVYFEAREPLTGTEAPTLSPETGHITNVYDLYRYDIPDEKLRFVAQAESQDSASPQISPDGRYYYFLARRVGGLPGGALAPGGGRFRDAEQNEGFPLAPTKQVYRYDSAEGLVQCVSCASPFTPEPKLESTFTELNTSAAFVTADGSRAFFETPAALLPSDVNGEIAPEERSASEFSTNRNSSPSSDVYEWRRDGTDGCARPQGCLGLITSGRSNFVNLLLGADPEGQSVFVYSRSQLGPNDSDTAGDVYDARIGGGEPPLPLRPIECEGDACHHPPTPPAEPTLSTSVSSGPGNEQPAAPRKHHRRKHAHAKHRRAGRNHGGRK